MLIRFQLVLRRILFHSQLHLRILLLLHSFYLATASYVLHPVQNEYILTYHKKLPFDDRIRRLSLLLNSSYLNYSIHLRPIWRVYGLSSDFDVITFHNLTGTYAHSFLSSIQNAPGIKRLYPQMRFQRNILSDSARFDTHTSRLLHQSGTSDLPGTIPLHPSKQPWKLLQARELWRKGYCGAGVRVGIFDTGLVPTDSHPHFKSARVIERSDWTVDENTGSRSHASRALDGHGHGTFVAGIIAATMSSSDQPDAILSTLNNHAHCPPPGMAPAADLYVFRVFTDSQVSYTSWFLDAFNYAIALKLHVINLSVGGPDFLDQPFVDKVLELSSNGILLVSAIGNDGPLFGTLNNPADQMDVLGVGGVDAVGRVARFSSRGMTTWYLPFGYGQIKPDIVSFSTGVISSAMDGTCQTLSGTSVASPVITGIVTLLIDVVLRQNAYLTAAAAVLPSSKLDPHPIVPLNPASIKQALIAGATRLSDVHVLGTDPPLWPEYPDSSSIFEQGAGLIDLNASFQIIQRLKPQASLFPSVLDLTQCPYMWPYCSQPFYYSMKPVVVNVTILNSMGVVGHITSPPVYHPYLDRNGQRLRVSFTYLSRLWPWSGHLAIHFEIQDDPLSSLPSALFYGTAEGFVTLTVQSRSQSTREVLQTHLTLPIRVNIIRTPDRLRRVLFDQFHSLRYPPAYIPRDDLTRKSEPLDWLGDHIHTNMRDMYTHLLRAGYYVEILTEPFTCFDAKNYGTLLLVDPEEEFFPDEIEKLFLDVTKSQLSLIVFAEWYNTSVMHNLRFFDTNTRRLWTPETGGANLPALNDLLRPFGAQLGDVVYAGDFSLGRRTIRYTSGSSLRRFPCMNISSVSGRGLLLHRKLVDLGDEFIRRLSSSNVDNVSDQRGPSTSNKLDDTISWRLTTSRSDPEPPILGLWTPIASPSSSGRLVVYGDSDCLTSTHLSSDCFWLLSALLQFVTSAYGRIPHPIADNLVPSSCVVLDTRASVPQRPKQSNLYTISNVIKNDPLFQPLSNGSLPFESYKPLHKCFTLPSAVVKPVDHFPIEGISYSPRPLLLHPKLMLPPLAPKSICHVDHFASLNQTRPSSAYPTSTAFMHFLLFYLLLVSIVYILYRCVVPNAPTSVRRTLQSYSQSFCLLPIYSLHRRWNPRRTPTHHISSHEVLL